MTDTDTQELRCPECGSEDKFKIAATVWVTVEGRDRLEIIDEGGDREYGSDDACCCNTCKHQAPLGDFYKEDQDDH